MVGHLFWDDKWQAVRTGAEPLTEDSMVLVREFEILPGQDQRDPKRFRPERYAIIEGDFEFTIGFASLLGTEKGKALPLKIDEDGYVNRTITNVGGFTIGWVHGLVPGWPNAVFRSLQHQTECLSFFEAAMRIMPPMKVQRYKVLADQGDVFAGNKVRYSDKVMSMLVSGKLNHDGTPKPEIGSSSYS